MKYYIDGYNLLFCLSNSQEPLEEQRDYLINDLQEKASFLNLNVVVIFDSANKEKLLQRSHLGELEIVYTLSGQTADQYIIERLRYNKSKEQITVVTSDKELAWYAHELKAQILTAKAFINWLNKKFFSKKQEKSPPPSIQNDDYYNYYLKVFQEKLRET